MMNVLSSTLVFCFLAVGNCHGCQYNLACSFDSGSCSVVCNGTKSPNITAILVYANSSNQQCVIDLETASPMAANPACSKDGITNVNVATTSASVDLSFVVQPEEFAINYTLSYRKTDLYNIMEGACNGTVEVPSFTDHTGTSTPSEQLPTSPTDPSVTDPEGDTDDSVHTPTDLTTESPTGSPTSNTTPPLGTSDNPTSGTHNNTSSTTAEGSRGVAVSCKVLVAMTVLALLMD